RRKEDTVRRDQFRGLVYGSDQNVSACCMKFAAELSSQSGEYSEDQSSESDYDVFGLECEKEMEEDIQKDSQVKLGKEMSLGAGAAITQKVYKSSRSLSDYDIYFPLVARVRICDEILWTAVTGSLPPPVPSPARYPKYRSLPFFSVKDSRLKDVKASNVLAMIQSLEQMTGDRPAEVDVGS
ncbi:hypothetical protein ADUPG1_001685, partial [Aduncisulcus paluster]